MPGVVVKSKVVPVFIVSPVFQVERSYLLQETYITAYLPNMEEHPGPPFSHKVTGSLLFFPLADSTKT